MSKIIGVIIGLLVGAAILLSVSAFFAWIVWIGWKLVAVAAFGAPALTFTQVWIGTTALNILLSAVRSTFKS